MASPRENHRDSAFRRTHFSYLFLLLLLLFASAASARELRIEKFESQVTVLPNGFVDVTENITFRFIGSWKGVYREIPVEYNTPQGMNFSLFLNVKSVTDSSGQSLKYETSRERHYRKLKIYVPEAQNSTRTIEESTIPISPGAAWTSIVPKPISFSSATAIQQVPM